MTAKEYLSQLITMDNAINRKQQRLMTLREYNDKDNRY